MLYTRKGDKGTTKLYGCNQSISKSSSMAEALGALDEINSFLGLCKVRSGKEKFLIGSNKCADLVHTIQQNLFIIQAELAGFPMRFEKNKVAEAEDVIEIIEKELPQINTFFISGGTELASLFDYARTVARRAERQVVAVVDEGKTKIGANTLAYLNRLSSLLYAFARYANFSSGNKEEPPSYK